MALLENLNSDNDIKETIYYQKDNPAGKMTALRDANTAFCSKKEEGEQFLPPLRKHPISPLERAQQEIMQNRSAVALDKSREEVSRMLDKKDLEFDLNQIWHDLRFRKIKKLPRELSVDADFPFNKLPDWVVRVAKKISKSLKVPIEAVLIALLAAIFIACRGSFVIEVNKNYLEALTAYLLVAIPSGGKKSAIVRLFRKIFEEFEAELQQIYDADSFYRETKFTALMTIKKKYRDKLLKSLDDESLENIQDYSRQLAEKLKPIELELKKMRARPKLLIDSPTPKGLAKEMERQGEFIGIFEAEGGLIKHRIRASDDNILLKGYTMEPFGDETSAGDTIIMSRPCLAWCSFVQGVVAEKLYANEDLNSDGLTPRILCAFLPSYRGDVI